MGLAFKILGLVLLIGGTIMVLLAKQLVPDHKYKGVERDHKIIKMRLIGFIICASSALIFLIVSLF